MESVAVRSSSLFYSIGAESNLSTKSPTAASRIATLRWTGRFGNLSARAILRHRRLGIQAVTCEWRIDLGCFSCSNHLLGLSSVGEGCGRERGL
ncbi:unnamed protein product [Rhodiola kirilowii]